MNLVTSHFGQLEFLPTRLIGGKVHIYLSTDGTCKTAGVVSVWSRLWHIHVFVCAWVNCCFLYTTVNPLILAMPLFSIFLRMHPWSPKLFIYSQTCLERPLGERPVLKGPSVRDHRCLQATWSECFVIVYNKIYFWFKTTCLLWPLSLCKRGGLSRQVFLWYVANNLDDQNLSGHMLPH